MDQLGKKVGYLRGLMEGLNFKENAPEGKLFDAMVDLLGDLSDRVESMDELLDDLNDYVESIDDDLSELEGDQGDDDDFDISDEDFEDDFDDAEDQLHLLGGGELSELDDDEAADTETLAGSICPECGRMFFVGMEDPEDAEYVCPHCGKNVTPTPLTPENAPIAHPVEKE